ncbi:MAG: diguanylate cyclase [Pseudomonadota bacterium]
MCKKLGTLKFRVVLVAVGSSLVTGLISTTYVTQETQKEAMRQLVHQQSDDVEVIAGVLGSKVEQIQRVLRLLGQGIRSETLGSPAQLKAFLAADSEALRYFDTIQIAQLDGKLVANRSLGKPLQLDDITAAQREVIERTFKARSGLVSPPIKIAKDDVPLVVFTMPLIGSDGRLFGVVAGGLKLHGQGLLPTSLDVAGSFESTLVVYNRSGTVLFHSDPRFQLQHVSNLPGLAQMHQAWLDDGANIMAESRTQVDDRHIVSTAGMPAPQWLVARITPKQVALAPMKAVERRSWLITGSTMAVCAALAALLIVRMTNPIVQLRNRAALIHADTLAPHAGWPQAGGEIGELTAALRAAAIERSRLPAQQAMVEQLRAILNYAPVGIFMARNSRLELIGKQACHMLGYDTDELIGNHTASIFGSQEAFVELQESMALQLSADGFFDTEMLLHRKDGSEFWAHVVARSISVDSEELSHIWIFEDITLARRAQEALAWKATHDPLTRLVNRREFEARLTHALTTVYPPVSERLALMFIDLDYFKEVNDGAGHAAGDAVLLRVAHVLEAYAGSGDTVCRLGGDEFAVILTGSTARRAKLTAEKIRAAIFALRSEFPEHAFQLSASIGFVVLDASFENVAAALSAADKACYDAKRGGRNCVVEHLARLV